MPCPFWWPRCPWCHKTAAIGFIDGSDKGSGFGGAPDSIILIPSFPGKSNCVGISLREHLVFEVCGTWEAITLAQGTSVIRWPRLGNTSTHNKGFENTNPTTITWSRDVSMSEVPPHPPHTKPPVHWWSPRNPFPIKSHSHGLGGWRRSLEHLSRMEQVWPPK